VARKCVHIGISTLRWEGVSEVRELMRGRSSGLKQLFWQVVGQGRDRTVLLIEPIERVGEIETFLEGLWPAVERANADLDEGARVERNMLLVVEPGAFVRAPKGTVVRQRTTDNFEGDIGKIIQAASRRDLGALANEQLV
jgi:hypothetical protein